MQCGCGVTDHDGFQSHSIQCGNDPDQQWLCIHHPVSLFRGLPPAALVPSENEKNRFLTR